MEAHLKPTCFYHPTKVLFLDDNINFLQTIEMDFSPIFDCITMTNTNQARKIIATSNENFNALLMTELDDEDTDTITDRLVDLELANIINFIYEAKRFRYLSVVVVDYDMPGENGVDFCRSIHDKPVLKIMLTAAADQSIAIKAFNEGIIDKFILKTDSKLNEELLEAIKEMQVKYFDHLSQTIVNSINPKVKALLSSPEYNAVFSKVKQSSHAVEHYLIDTSGSFLFLDENGKPTWLIVRNDDDFARFSEIVLGYDANQEIQSALKDRSKLLFLLSTHDMKKPVKQWNNYLFDAIILNNTNYYSVITDKTDNLVDWDKLISYVNRS